MTTFKFDFAVNAYIDSPKTLLATMANRTASIEVLAEQAAEFSEYLDVFGAACYEGLSVDKPDTPLDDTHLVYRYAVYNASDERIADIGVALWKEYTHTAFEAVVIPYKPLAWDIEAAFKGDSVHFADDGAAHFTQVEPFLEFVKARFI